MAKVKTAISVDEKLFKEADERASKMEISRSEFYARAVEKFVREEENRELFERLNEAHADGMDEEDEELLERYKVYYRDRFGNGR